MPNNEQLQKTFFFPFWLFLLNLCTSDALIPTVGVARGRRWKVSRCNPRGNGSSTGLGVDWKLDRLLDFMRSATLWSHCSLKSRVHVVWSVGQALEEMQRNTAKIGKVNFWKVSDSEMEARNKKEGKKWKSHVETGPPHTHTHWTAAISIIALNGHTGHLQGQAILWTTKMSEWVLKDSHHVQHILWSCEFELKTDKNKRARTTLYTCQLNNTFLNNHWAKQTCGGKLEIIWTEE